VDDLLKKILVGCFIAGLKYEIRLDVHVKQPKTLSESISVAHLIEERNQFQKKTSSQFRPAAPPFHPRPQQSSIAGLLVPSPSQRTSQTTDTFSGPIRRLTGQEARERREKGLRFYCDERYVPGHRFSRPQLFMMVDVQPNEEEDDVDIDIEPSEEAIPEISFHALAGTAHPQTFRIIGRVGNRDLTMLIDGGSTHNFIDQSVVTKLGLQVVRGKTFKMIVGNKEVIECTRRCLGLSLSIQGITVRADFFVLPVAAYQAVLGVQWLETLGPIKTDYKKLSMSFTQAGRTHMISDVKPIEDTKLPPDLSQILSEFALVFEEPTELPPTSNHDHRISLLPNQPPVNTRPYRYSHYQKNEIEKLVKEFLQSEIICPSRSPFSSPILLIKKSDGS